MKIHLIILAAVYSALALPMAHILNGNTPSKLKRDLVGLLGGSGPSITTSDQLSQSVHTLQATTLSTIGLSGIITSEENSTKRLQTVQIDSPSTLTTPASWSTATLMTTNSQSSELPIPSIDFGVKEAASTPPAEATEWKVIGVAFVALTFVGALILSITFFDSWWGFIRDMMLGKKEGEGTENLVPDWEKRSWEFKLANEDGHRYPSLSSLEGITKQQQPEEKLEDDRNPFTPRPNPSPNPCYTSPALPQATFLGEYDSKTLLRNPSAKYQHVTGIPNGR